MMKKLLVVAAVLGSLLVVAFGAAFLLLRRAEAESDAAVARFARSAPAVAVVTEKNATAAQLEHLARKLSIELRPGALRLADRVADNPKVIVPMTAWLRSHEESTTDAIEAPPADVAAWLATHDGTIDAIAAVLVNGEPPRWPLDARASAPQQSIPNLLGHMHLFRVLNAATLERERRGDHDGAWNLQHAAWKLSVGLFDRPEIITSLIGIAGVRMSAATQRKLEAPVPPWQKEIAQRPLTKEMLDTVRVEIAQISHRVRDGRVLADAGSNSDDRPAGARLSEAVVSPVFRWAAAENAHLLFEELRAMEGMDPCRAAQQNINAAIKAKASFVTRHVASVMLPNLSSAVTRAAIADLAAEAASKVLTVKSARLANPGGEWPVSIAGIDSSRCEGERWLYGRDAAGGMSLRFTGELPDPSGGRAPRILLEYRAGASNDSQQEES